MTSVDFTPASALTLERLTEVFNLGFRGYYLPMAQTPDGLAQMIRENDVRLDDSSVLSVNGELAGLGLVGVRGSRGWIAGMGVAPLWRGQGIGAQLLGQLLSGMVESGLRRAQLEALTVNIPAQTLYERLGFRTSRPLNVYHGPLRLEAWHPKTHGGDARLRPVLPRMALRDFDVYHTVAPAWQREHETLAHMRGVIEGLGLWDDSRLGAYLLFSRQSGGFALLDGGSSAPEADVRRADMVTLLRALAEPAPESIFRAINAPPGDALGDALGLLGCQVAVTQVEMLRSLP